MSVTKPPRQRPPATPAPTVPRLYAGETVVILASGPSLTREDVAFVRGKARVIAINRSIQLAPWADVLYCADARMWKWLHDDGALTGVTAQRYGLERGHVGLNDVTAYGVTVLQTQAAGLAHSPDRLSRGAGNAHSGYQAINLAVHLGASRIVLLGYDGQARNGRTHWHAPHPRISHAYDVWQVAMRDLVEPLAALGVEIVNCSRATAYTCFPVRPLRDVLSDAAVAA